MANRRARHARSETTGTRSSRLSTCFARIVSLARTPSRLDISYITDDVAGWTEISIPMTDFVRSADQPAGAPNDGLGLDEVWGYSLGFPTGSAASRAGAAF